MMTAAARPEPATSPTTTPSFPSGSTNTSYQSPPTLPVPVTYRAARSVPGTSGSVAGMQAAVQRHRGQRVVLRHEGVQGERRPVGGQLQQFRVLRVNERPLSEPTCRTPMTLPPANSGTPSSDLMPRSNSSGLRTVAWLPRSGSPARRWRRPGRRSPCRAGSARPGTTSSSMPLAAVATSWLADWSSSSTAAVSASRCLLHPLEQRLEQRLLVQPGQGSVGYRLDVSQPVGGSSPRG